jgi:streptogramin lyase
MRWSIFTLRGRKTSCRKTKSFHQLGVESLEQRTLLSADIMQQFNVPSPGGNPAFIAPGRPGDTELWFTDASANGVGRVGLNGVFDTFIPLRTAFSGPEAITAGPDGNMWVIENQANQIARITPYGTVTEFRAPQTVNGNLSRLIVGPDRNFWFTAPSLMGRMTTSGVFTEFPVPGYFRTNTPANLAAGPDGNIWFTLPWANEVGYVTTSGSFHMFTTGISGQSFPTGITAGPDGNMWFTEPAADQVARITTSGVVTEFSVGITRGSAPTQIIVGPDGALWFTEPVAIGNHIVNPQIGRITINGSVTEYAIPNWGACSGGITVGRDGNIWFADQMSTGGRIDMLDVRSILPTNLGGVANALSHSYESYANFINHAYEHYLSRLPNATELAGWVSAMQNGLSDEQVDATFIGAPEFIQDHGGLGAGWVESMYQDLLNRTPSQQEIHGWLLAIQSGWTPAQVAYGFAASPERESIRVQQDYTTFLGRVASPIEVAGWVNAFINLHYSNEDVIAGFASSWEYYINPRKGMGDNTGWIESAYQDILHRAPTTDELDQWLAYLQVN